MGIYMKKSVPWKTLNLHLKMQRRVKGGTGSKEIEKDLTIIYLPCNGCCRTTNTTLLVMILSSRRMVKRKGNIQTSILP